MKYNILKSFGLTASTTIGIIGLSVVPVAALAGTGSASSSSGSTTAGTSSTSTPSSASSAHSQARLEEIINRGNSEITRRLTSLNTLDSKISSSTRLSAGDQSTLTSEVNNEISGLTTLKTTLDGETQVANAITDAQSIFSDYRVFALVLPQANLIQAADRQQTTEGKLSSLAAKIQSDISADQSAGKNVTDLQTQLDAMTAKVQAAQTISSSIESGVVALTPSDYNTNHAVLSGDHSQLVTAQGDISTAISDAKNLVSSLK